MEEVQEHVPLVLPLRDIDVGLCPCLEPPGITPQCDMLIGGFAFPSLPEAQKAGDLTVPALHGEATGSSEAAVEGLDDVVRYRSDRRRHPREDLLHRLPFRRSADRAGPNRE